MKAIVFLCLVALCFAGGNDRLKQRQQQSLAALEQALKGTQELTAELSRSIEQAKKEGKANLQKLLDETVELLREVESAQGENSENTFHILPIKTNNRWPHGFGPGPVRPTMGLPPLEPKRQVAENFFAVQGENSEDTFRILPIKTPRRWPLGFGPGPVIPTMGLPPLEPKRKIVDNSEDTLHILPIKTENNWPTGFGPGPVRPTMGLPPVEPKRDVAENFFAVEQNAQQVESVNQAVGFTEAILRQLEEDAQKRGETEAVDTLKHLEDDIEKKVNVHSGKAVAAENFMAATPNQADLDDATGLTSALLELLVKDAQDQKKTDVANQIQKVEQGIRDAAKNGKVISK